MKTDWQAAYIRLLGEFEKQKELIRELEKRNKHLEKWVKREIDGHAKEFELKRKLSLKDKLN